MNDFEELWLVDDDEEANQLMKLGWKFIQVVYEDREIKEYKGYWFKIHHRTVGTAKEPKFLLGRPKGVEPRGNNSWGHIEDLDEYVERLGEQKK